MKKLFSIFVCIMAFAPSVHAADKVPAEALDKDFTACMGGQSPQQDPERGEYCTCIRNTMKDWSVEQYEQVAMEGSKAKTADQEPQKLQEIAKVCISKVLGNAPQ